MSVDAVIFDLDGTLADTLRDIASAMDHALKSFGLPTYSLDEYRGFVGEGARQLVRKALPRSAAPREEEVLRAFRQRYINHLVVHTRPYDGVAAMLRSVASRGMAMAVLSNKPHAMTTGVVQALFDDIPFVGVLGQREGVPRKPDPTAALELCGRMGTAPTSTAMVGDTRFDIETAQAAGMPSVGVAWGFGTVEGLWEAGASAVIEKPDELLSWCEGA